MNSITNSLYLIKPEISISIVLVCVVTFNLIFKDRSKVLPWLSIIGLIISGYFVIGQFSLNSSAFSSPDYKGLLVADPFGAFFKLLIVFSSILVILFSITNKELDSAKDRLGEYYSLIFGMILGMFFMVSAADLILIYLSVELLSLSSYVLAGFTKKTLRNSEASLKYVIYGGVSSGIMLFGISLVYGLTGTTNLYEINSLIQAPQINQLTIIFAGILIFAGIGFKISVAPFHFWTPDVYEGAPVTITAYLSVASKAAGFALLIRFIKVGFISSVNPEGYWQLIHLIDWKSFFILISIITMTLGNFAALWQNNMKRLLAYSSIAHAGYLMLGLVVMSNEGILAVMIYFVVYTIMNLGAFFIVMLIANKIGSEELDDYKGLGYSTPVLGICLTIFLVSLTGLPPTAGFIAKLYLFIALVDAKMIAVAIIALLNTVVSLYYYIRVLKNMYLDKSEKEIPQFSASVPNLALLFALVTPIIFFGIYFTPIIDLARNSLVFFGF
jgi:NADH-quinone oxidoreductase subunit N